MKKTGQSKAYSVAFYDILVSLEIAHDLCMCLVLFEHIFVLCNYVGLYCLRNKHSTIFQKIQSTSVWFFIPRTIFHRDTLLLQDHHKFS